VRRTLLLLIAIVVLAVAAVATINRLVDPENEFYSGAPLTAALETSCLVGDDVVGERSYSAFKQDLFQRRQPETVLLGSGRVLRFGPRGRETSFLNLGFPGLDPSSLLGVLTGLGTPKPLTVLVATELSWFDPRADAPTFDKSFESKAAYLLSPRTLKSSLGLIRRSRTLAFKGWQQETTGRGCTVDRGSATPSWTLYGTRTPVAPVQRRQSAFAWHRLTPLDDALALAQRRGWRVVGFSPPEPTRGPSSLWDTYRRELQALFAKHGFTWLDRSGARGFSWALIRPKLDAAARA